MLPEIEARKILENYNGYNNQILEWKLKFENNPNYKLTRPQSDYILKYHSIVPKIAKKYINIYDEFAEKLKEEKTLIYKPDKIWCEKLLCQSDKAYHMWGKLDDKLVSFWLPKNAIIQEEKKLNRIIDYSPYDFRAPMEHQKVAIEKLLSNDKFILADQMGTGKGLTLNTLIYTPHGTKKIGDVIVGDEVIGSNGESCNVTGVFFQGVKEIYSITFNDGFKIKTDESHLWSITKNKKQLVISTKEMYESKSNKKWKIPVTKPINFNNNQELKINPYSLGQHLSNKKVKIQHIKNKLNVVDDNDVKYIPNDYKYSNTQNRIDLLNGLMDTTGYCKNNKLIYKHNSEKMLNDVSELIQTLGGIAYKKNKKVKFILPPNVNPFSLKTKNDEYEKIKKLKLKRYITNIEKINSENTVCISVDSPDKLYVAEHCIVTHNTTSAIIASLESNSKKVLIVCPASLKINWKREIENYTNKKVLIVEGRKWADDYDYYIINYDIIKNFHSIDDDNSDFNLLVNANFELAIVDEAHFLSNNSANRTQLLNDVLDKIPKVWLLTGTPLTSRPINYFNLLKIINSPLSLNWQSYVKRYCAGYQMKVGNKRVWKTTGASNLNELHEKTKNSILRRLKTDILDLPEKLITPIYLELNNKMYDEELEEFIKIKNYQKNDENITVTINRLMKIRQIIAQEKIPYTCEIIDKCIDDNKKILVFTNFTSTLEMLHEKYKKNSVILDGRMNNIKRQISVDRFQNDDKINLFIGNIKAAGAGITLTSAEIVIMNDLSFVPSDHAQAEDRAHRYGVKKTVNVYYPIFDNTIERIVYNILQKKKNIIDQIMGDGEYSQTFSDELLKTIL